MRAPTKAGSDWVAALAGWPRRPNQSIPLLPSGPGGVFNLSSRGADKGHHRIVRIWIRVKVAEREGLTRDILSLALRAASPSKSAVLPICRTARLLTLSYSLRRMSQQTHSSLHSTKWRRERDSNPRYGVKPYTHFPGVLLKPLGHLSASTTILLQPSLVRSPLGSCLARSRQVSPEGEP